MSPPPSELKSEPSKKPEILINPEDGRRDMFF
jgi:hypothetical protein